jgi:hypothetical protein
VTFLLSSYRGQLCTDIEAALSSDRLTVYRKAAGGDLERAVELYRWNIAIGAALYGPLAILEVVLRNALDAELGRAFAMPWYDDAAFLSIDPKMTTRLSEVKEEIKARGSNLSRGSMIAGLSFGFWVNLLRPGPNGVYVPTLWDPHSQKHFRLERRERA